MPARDRTMYKDTVYEYYEGFTKGLTVHCIFKQALKHKWMIDTLRYKMNCAEIKWPRPHNQKSQEMTPFV